MKTTDRPDSGTSPAWQTIENPLTGERVTFIETGAARCVFDLVLTPGRLPIATHRHPGREVFSVIEGSLTLTVDGVERRLEPGDEAAITTEWHSPSNAGDVDVVVRVTCEPGAFAERGIRGAFGLCRDGLVGDDGRPKDLLSFALLSENGRYAIRGVPVPLWKVLMTVLGAVAVLRGRRRVLDRYWPPDLARPWRRRPSARQLVVGSRRGSMP